MAVGGPPCILGPEKEGQNLETSLTLKRVSLTSVFRFLMHKGWFPKYGHWARCTSIIWELERNSYSSAPSQTYFIWNSGGGGGGSDPEVLVLRIYSTLHFVSLDTHSSWYDLWTSVDPFPLTWKHFILLLLFQVWDILTQVQCLFSEFSTSVYEVFYEFLWHLSWVPSCLM